MTRTWDVGRHDELAMTIPQFPHLRGTNILVKNVNARVFTNQMWTDGQRTKTNPKTSPEQSAIFQLVQEINKTNAKNVTSIVFDHKVSLYIQPYIYKTNLFTKFHDDWAKNVTSRVHVIQLTATIFQLNSCIKETNVLTKFHENWAKNVTSRVFTCFPSIHIEKNAPPTGGHVFLPIWTIFELVQHINKTNVLINFHDDWAQIVTSIVFTRKTATPTGSHLHEDWALNVTSTVFKLDRDFIGANLLTKFHEDRTINVASRVFTNKCGRMKDGQRPVTKAHLSKQMDRQTDGQTETKVLTKFHENWAQNVTSRVLTCFHYKHIEKNAPPTGGHVFSPIWTIFKLVREINKTNVLTNFHDDWAKIVTSRVFTRKTAPPTGGHVFQRTGTTFELNQHIIKTNILTKLNEDWARNMTSSVLNFKLDRDLIGTKLLTKFHEDRTINVASRINILTKFHKDWMKTVTSTVYTSKLLTDAHMHAHTDAGHHTVT
ncbi:hypothetical protein DPMN_127838 [Dreissena polymorpha]|uniref:Uncharacterized protein n=1 Tax=Dreissena polymorpha TaxID=45954 RepID=A0A9D4JVU0_DREPO|nr:hypothetical protein DPMN_127838 [Dreissena polymorpha]